MAASGGDRTRRGFLRDTAITGGLSVGALAVGASPAGALPRASGRRVAVLGGGVGGLTAAHELAERGFKVTVYERKALGGKARSIPVPGSASGGRRDLPGEHGFRFFPGFYRNVPDTMRRIPFPGNPRGVGDNLVTGTRAFFSQMGKPDFALTIPRNGNVLTPEVLRDGLTAVLTLLPDAPPPHEIAFFANKLIAFMTSGPQRRVKQWEYMSWLDFSRSAQMSPAYQRIQRIVTSALVAAKAETACTRTIGLMAEAFFLAILGRGNDGDADRLLNAPTNEAWIDPWVAYLKSRGVTFKTGWTITDLDYHGGKVTQARVTDPKGTRGAVQADWFVLAVPAERAAPLMNTRLVKADPALGRIGRIKTDWMNGVMFYLREQVPISRGHGTFLDAPWALTSISQGQFWRADFPRTYGDGTVKDCLSIDVSDWDTPGILYGKKAKDCTREQIAAEVWAQVQRSLDNGTKVLPDRIRHSVFVDPAVTDPGTPRVRNDEPLMINTIGSWDNRPHPHTKIPNLFLAADFVRNTVNLATMEGANESARAAVNALLAQAGSSAAPAKVFPLYEEPLLERWRDHDDARYRLGLPNQFDLIQPDWPKR